MAVFLDVCFKALACFLFSVLNCNFICAPVFVCFLKLNEESVVTV